MTIHSSLKKSIKQLFDKEKKIKLNSKILFKIRPPSLKSITKRFYEESLFSFKNTTFSHDDSCSTNINDVTEVTQANDTDSMYSIRDIIGDDNDYYSVIDLSIDEETDVNYFDIYELKNSGVTNFINKKFNL